MEKFEFDFYETTEGTAVADFAREAIIAGFGVQVFPARLRNIQNSVQIVSEDFPALLEFIKRTYDSSMTADELIVVHKVKHNNQYPIIR